MKPESNAASYKLETTRLPNIVELITIIIIHTHLTYKISISNSKKLVIQQVSQNSLLPQLVWQALQPLEVPLLHQTHFLHPKLVRNWNFFDFEEVCAFSGMCISLNVYRSRGIRKRRRVRLRQQTQ